MVTAERDVGRLDVPEDLVDEVEAQVSWLFWLFSPVTIYWEKRFMKITSPCLGVIGWRLMFDRSWVVSSNPSTRRYLDEYFSHLIYFYFVFLKRPKINRTEATEWPLKTFAWSLFFPGMQGFSRHEARLALRSVGNVVPAAVRFAQEVREKKEKLAKEEAERQKKR